MQQISLSLRFQLMTKEEISAAYSAATTTREEKNVLFRQLVILEIEDCAKKGIYPTVASYAKDKMGTNYVADFVISLVREEGFEIGSAIAQFESSF